MIQPVAARLLLLFAVFSLASCGAAEPGAQASTPASAPTRPPEPTLALLPTSLPPAAPAAPETPTALPGPTSAAPTSAPTPRAPSGPTGGARHLVAALDGTLLLRRPGWPSFVPIGFGTLLAAGDTLTLTSGEATILCTDLSSVVLPAGAELVLELDLCVPGGVPRIGVPDGLVKALRGRNPELPFVISPRATALRDPLPLIRWNDTGSPPYDVLVTAEGHEWRVEDVPSTSVRYDGRRPLAQGGVYLVVVTDSAGQTSLTEQLPGLGFWLLAEGPAAEVAAELAQLEAAALPPPGAAYGRFWLLAGRDLRAEAAAELEALIAAGQGGAAAPLALGDLYRRQGLTLLAERVYRQAVALAEAADDQPMLAAAEAGLGEVLYQLGDASAVTSLTAARDRFERLGDAARIAELDDLLADIQ